MKDLCFLTYGIVGLGIMGGSIAKAIQQNVLNRSQNFLEFCSRIQWDSFLGSTYSV
ncbi:MAG: hypothetical protein IKP67_00085 [Spirochaetales bacterium]|nr:hypothetical protein [Spirochaetales bacterium]